MKIYISICHPLYVFIYMNTYRDTHTHTFKAIHFSMQMYTYTKFVYICVSIFIFICYLLNGMTHELLYLLGMTLFVRLTLPCHKIQQFSFIMVKYFFIFIYIYFYLHLVSHTITLAKAIYSVLYIIFSNMAQIYIFVEPILIYAGWPYIWECFCIYSNRLLFVQVIIF